MPACRCRAPPATRNGPPAAFLSVDGERGLGPVVAMAALDAIIPRAREDGIAIAAIRNTNHLGALAYYAEMSPTRASPASR